MKRVFLTFLGVFFVAGLLVNGCGKKMTEQQYYDLAVEYEQNEDFSKASETYLTIYKRFPSGKHGSESLVKDAFFQAHQLGEFERAIKTNKRLKRTFTDSKYIKQSSFMIGYIYANDIKDYDKEKEIYQEFMEKYPDHELVSSVKWELENLGKDINEIDFITEEKPDTSKSN